ncbi:hypothetical protein DFJ58DRAFT_734943 [Suillus subalutaceus]|uniref:uncharacterized protein n=1 Tax=Suillus subalutaceus TaxID=48586 RepID=UPI001B880B81|nr:uncharacterized protein DFJ58DRAFT_734943 [Suillus subalutaceus]KAG1836520.1 hypothetical protein DFJ58DRAFT_734943 [Suillus subalutaceus]
MPLLRDLHSVLCDLPQLHVDHTSLKLQSLTLLDIRAVFPSNDDDANSRNLHTRLQMLAKVPTNSTLTYDHTVWLYHIFTFPPHPPRSLLSASSSPSIKTVPELCRPSSCSSRLLPPSPLSSYGNTFLPFHYHWPSSSPIGDWVDGVVLAIVARFPNLTKLQVRYARGAPSEDTILGMGSRTLVLEVRKRDDDIIYGAPDFGDTYSESMHDIDTVEDMPIEGVLSLQQLHFSQDAAVTYSQALPGLQGKGWSARTSYISPLMSGQYTRRDLTSGSELNLTLIALLLNLAIEGIRYGFWLDAARRSTNRF